jgi:hypothetical protein
LVVCDFKESSGRYVPDLLRDAAFVGVEAEELLFPRTHRRWSGAILAVGRK